MIEDLLEHIGIEDIRSLGAEVQARCPLHEKRTGEADPDWPDWYAEYMVREQTGEQPPE